MKTRHQRGLDSTRQKRARARFLAVLAGPAAGSIPKAAKAVGISRATPHFWAKRDEAFAQRMVEAKGVGELVHLDTVEREIDRRAVEGWEEPVYQKGERVGTVRKYSDLLLMFRAKKLNPAYRDNHPPFFDAPLGGRLRMIQYDADGTRRILELGGPDLSKPALPAPKGKTDEGTPDSTPRK